MAADATSFNRYWYANNSPYNNIDPDGRNPVLVVALIVAGGDWLLRPSIANAPAPDEPTYSNEMSTAEVAQEVTKVIPAGKLGAMIKMGAKAEKIRPGRSENKVKPDPNATGDHSTFKRGADGSITNTATYEVNSRNPSGFQETKRVDVTGKAHTNSDGTVVPTPHVKEAGEKGVRPARPEELPRK